MTEPAGTPPVGTPPEGTPPAGTPPAGAPAGTLDINSLQGEKFHNVLPEEIRTKPYMKDINTFSDFVKKFDGAQTLIGQRSVPADDAKPEEWDAWFAKTGRPEKPDGYANPEIEGVPKEYVAKASEAGVMKQLMHSAGLNQHQAKVLSSNFLKVVYDSEIKAKAEADKSFEKTMETAFGKDREVVLANGKKMLAAYLPESVKPLLNGLDDKSWAIILAATDGIVKKHVSEDGFKGGAGAGAGGDGTDTKDSITAKMREIMAQKEYGDPYLDRGKHTALLQQMEELRVRLRKIS